MTKGKAIILGVFSIWPLLYIFIFMGSIFVIMATSFAGNSPSNEPPLIMLVIFPLHLFTMLEIFVLLAVYMFYLFRTEIVPQDKKALWAVVLFLGNMISIPIFWYIYIWKKLKESETSEQISGEGREEVPLP